MALVKFGGGVAGLSGKIGGTVFSRNKAGAIARNWAKPTNAPSVSQSANRARFAGGPFEWNILDRGTQTEWDALAATTTRINRIGESYIPTGRQLFLQAYNNLSVVGQAMPASTPTTDVQPDPLIKPGTLLEETASVITTFTLTGVVIADTQIIIEATKPFANKKTNFTNDYRTIFTGPTAATYAIVVPYAGIFGSVLNESDEVAIRIAVVSKVTGLRSDSITYIQTAAEA